ncbi:methionyl-tRNA formyltransferase [Psychroflexus halocasei]|uniref:Methionyl-tRNA formyltransferase n=1 Tax=Psychroflexus halocasei TaxID=908615 RepID=A0A1H3X2X7_9FLAO|nr:methionyl-tRNA formyltransferase [Psychroflexus halocasei]SDZ92868.1 methionyl-tRNA formyltransferase [Psychroflexus halocasei]
MKKLKILFLGTPDFAVETLSKLHQHFEIVGVVTAPDKPSGRGRKLNQSAVKKYALEKNLEVLQPTNLKSDEFQQDLNRLNPNLAIVVAFRMLPKKVWSFPEYGTFNIHASLLPNYRGAAPINWAVMNGEKETGVTSFYLDEKIDTGAIIDSRSVEIEKHETAGSLHDKLMVLGADLAVETAKAISEGSAVAKKQIKDSDYKEAPKLTKENTKINWNNDADQIINFVNGLNPYPLAWASLIEEGKTVQIKIGCVEIENEIDQEAHVGELILKKNKLLIKSRTKWISIKELKYPGKKMLKIQDFLNGYNQANADKMEL